jgi:hypothetical protein
LLFLPLLGTLAVALVGASAAVWLGLPLPWFTGTLIAVAGVSVAGARLREVPHARDAGQWIIGATLGLYFTPQVVQLLVQLAPWVAANLLFVIVLGLAGAWLLRALSGESGTTCFFAAAIGGASEMAAQAERFGGRVDRAAAAHSLRIFMVALIVPLALQASGVSGADSYVPVASRVDAVGWVALAAITGGAAVVLRRGSVPNAWMIGPLLAAAGLSAGGLVFSAMPAPVLNGGQLLIGVALGARFTPEFFRAAPRHLASVALVTLMYLLVSAGFGAGLASFASLGVPTAILATTPGGIGEMALTAKLLALGAPIVTAFHAIRMAALVLMIGGLCRLVLNRRTR